MIEDRVRATNGEIQRKGTTLDGTSQVLVAAGGGGSGGHGPSPTPEHHVDGATRGWCWEMGRRTMATATSSWPRLVRWTTTTPRSGWGSGHTGGYRGKGKKNRTKEDLCVNGGGGKQWDQVRD